MSTAAASVQTPPTYNFFSPEVPANPHPLLHRLRANEPVYRSPQFNGWVLTRHEDIVAASKDRRLVAANMTGWLDQMSGEEKRELKPVRDAIRLWVGHTNEQDHLRFQRVFKKYFTPATVEGLRPRVQELTDELLDTVQDRGEMEVVSQLSFPLPANVIAELLGVPTADRELLLRWSADVVPLFRRSSIETLRQSQRSVLEMHDYMRPIIAARRREPRNDLISVMVAAQNEGLILNEEEIVANCVLLLFAGHETTAHLISQGLMLLLEHPEQLNQLKANPELMPGAIEEMLRYNGPASAMMRTSIEPLELAGRQFDAGQLFVLVYMAGNRDPEVFADPDRFDITRKPNKHLAFGMGAYYCLGAALARMEVDVCFRTLLRRMPNLRPAFTQPDLTLLPPLVARLRTLRVAF
ncbi:cytochrome P450 [Archangium violaceum]|uniref:cytochrome P450 n=1 Tax=Archangium violaceum TaxID=83451 RepID=UPI002B28471D|nr:cytochrome P450 [Archangium violaceum]